MGFEVERAGKLFVYAVLASATFVALFPLSLMVVNSLRTNFELFMNPLGLPEAPNWGIYAKVWAEGELGQALFNSVRVAGLTILLVCATASMAAWVLARRRIRGWMAVSLYFLATTTIPVQLFMFPLYFLFARLGLVNQPLAVVVIYAALYTPFALFLLRTYILAIPVELEEAARIDGASDWMIFTRIILPLLSPGLVTVALIVGLNAWNEFIIAITFLQTGEAATAISKFYQLSGRYANDWPEMMATATLIATPVVIFFVLLQRRFIAGVASGAVKA